MAFAQRSNQPRQVRTVRAELAVHRMIRAGMGDVRPGAALAASPAGDALQTAFAHQPLDAFVDHLTTETRRSSAATRRQP